MARSIQILSPLLYNACRATQLGQVFVCVTGCHQQFIIHGAALALVETRLSSISYASTTLTWDPDEPGRVLTVGAKKFNMQRSLHTVASIDGGISGGANTIVCSVPMDAHDAWDKAYDVRRPARRVKNLGTCSAISHEHCSYAITVPRAI